MVGALVEGILLLGTALFELVGDFKRSGASVGKETLPGWEVGPDGSSGKE